MNQIFDANRFGKLFIREFNRNQAKLMWLGGLTFGIFMLTIIYGLVFHTDAFKFSFTAFGAVVILLAPVILEKGTDQIKSILDFTLPASSFEKFLVKWCFSVLIMPFYITCLLFLVAGLYSILPAELGADAANDIIDYYRSGATLDEVLTLFSFQSIFFLGVFYFRKNVFWKTLLCIILYIILTVFVFFVTHQEIFTSGLHPFTIGFGTKRTSVSFGKYISSLNTQNEIITYLSYLITPFGYWVVALLKLKETEL